MVPLQVALHKTHQGKPFWLSRDEIDIGLYAEALTTVFRFLPEEESIPIFATCLEPERSEAVKIVVARAGLMLALEVRSLSNSIYNLLTKLQAPRLSWQKPLFGIYQVTARRFRDIYKVSILRVVYCHETLMVHQRLQPHAGMSRTNMATIRRQHLDPRPDAMPLIH